MSEKYNLKYSGPEIDAILEKASLDPATKQYIDKAINNAVTNQLNGIY